MPNVAKKISSFLSCLAISLVFILPISNAFAIPNPYDGTRSVSWNSSEGMCEASGLDFDPFSANKDITWEIDNGTCLAYMAAAGLTVAVAEKASSIACGYAENVVAVVAQMALNIVLSPMTVVRRMQETGKCLVSSPLIGASCCFTTLGSTIAVGVAVGQLAAIHSTAQGAFDTARICGRKWYNWSKIDEFGEEDPYGEKWSRGSYTGSHKQYLKELFTSDAPASAANAFALTNQNFREYLYGGIEYKDEGNGSCNNPWDSATRLKYLGYDDDKQRYYMTGPGSPSNYACTRFLSSDQTDAEAQAAYDCCKERSENTICIESRAVFNDAFVAGSSWEKIFCELGSRCNVGGVWYDIYQASTSNNYICAKTYSVCPYNHPLGGGTEKESIDDNGELVNFCQVMNHCVKIPTQPYIRHSNFNSAFVSKSCKDLKGDTQNIYSYDRNILTGSRRNFSAPMAQCFKETMQNMFLNRAGHTKCSNPAEIPNADGTCTSNNYKYRVGSALDEAQYPSFFLKIRENLQLTIKVALSFSVIGLGVMVLLGMSPLGKKQILGYILKLALVLFFAVGNGWQHGFVDGILNSSADLSEMVFKLDENRPADELDGCQFPRFNYNDDDVATMFAEPAYPPGKEYLRIWDTLDCKLGRAMGYGPEITVPNIALMIVGGFMTGGLGIVFFISSIAMAFFLLSIIIRALHIFIMSVTAIIILLYISPITITLAMFNRTKGIFEGWWKQVLGYTLQPVILFAYLAVFISFFDTVMIGDATFQSAGVDEPKRMVCTGTAKDESLYCIFRVSEVRNYTALEIIGVAIPILQDMNKTKLNTIIQAAFMLFIFLTFLDKITKFSKELVGGGLESDWNASFAKFSGATYKAASAFQKRRDRAIVKHVFRENGAGRSTARWAKNKMEKGNKYLRNRGK